MRNRAERNHMAAVFRSAVVSQTSRSKVLQAARLTSWKRFTLLRAGFAARNTAALLPQNLSHSTLDKCNLGGYFCFSE
jgi:hypothetical protein